MTHGLALPICCFFGARGAHPCLRGLPHVGGVGFSSQGAKALACPTPNPHGARLGPPPLNTEGGKGGESADAGHRQSHCQLCPRSVPTGPGTAAGSPSRCVLSLFGLTVPVSFIIKSLKHNNIKLTTRKRPRDDHNLFFIIGGQIPNRHKKGRNII